MAPMGGRNRSGKTWKRTSTGHQRSMSVKNRKSRSVCGTSPAGEDEVAMVGGNSSIGIMYGEVTVQSHANSHMLV